MIIMVFLKTFENEEIKFDGDMKNYDLLHTWSGERCTSLVREITFENAEVRF